MNQPATAPRVSLALLVSLLTVAAQPASGASNAEGKHASELQTKLKASQAQARAHQATIQNLHSKLEQQALASSQAAAEHRVKVETLQKEQQHSKHPAGGAAKVDSLLTLRLRRELIRLAESAGR